MENIRFNVNMFENDVFQIEILRDDTIENLEKYVVDTIDDIKCINREGFEYIVNNYPNMRINTFGIKKQENNSEIWKLMINANEKNIIDVENITRIMEITDIYDIERVKNLYNQNNKNVDATTNALLEPANVESNDDESNDENTDADDESSVKSPILQNDNIENNVLIQPNNLPINYDYKEDNQFGN